MDNPRKYILFCADEANFQTRSMLIPYDLIMKCPERIADLDILRKHTKKDVMFLHRNHMYTVDQLLTQDMMWEDGFGRIVNTPYTKIIYEFREYAHGMEEGMSSSHMMSNGPKK